MVATIGAIALTGLHPHQVRVEAATGSGLPGTTIVGLPDASVREAADRVRTACQKSGFQLSKTRLVVNLSPGGLRKTGSGFDLAVALAMLAASGELAPDDVTDLVALGELGLDGTVRPTPGTLPIVAAARDLGVRRVVVAESVAPEACLVDGISVIGVSDLRTAVEVLAGRAAPDPTGAPRGTQPSWVPDIVDVRGQPVARRALEIVAAGGHHLLMMGPPGCGKSMLARRVPGLLPPLSTPQALEVAAVRSVAGERRGDEPLDLTPPFRDPHHSTSLAGLVGGGTGVARPGEISLAHRGVLFLDELLETPRWVLDALRQPLESGHVVLVRSQGTATYPAHVQLIAATNPCPCGGGSAAAAASSCRCRPDQVERYRARLSGPLLDRIDVQVELTPVDADALAGPPDGEATATVAARVRAARAAAEDRWGIGATNRDVDDARLRDTVDVAAIRRLVTAVSQLHLSVRAFGRCLRVARTIADLDGSDAVRANHVDESVGYRLAGPAAVAVPR